MLPASSPAITKSVFLETEPETSIVFIPFCFALDDSNDKYALDDRFKALMPGNYNTFYIDPTYQLDDFEAFYKLFIGLDKDHEDELESLGLLGYARYFASWLIIEPDDKYKGI